MSDTASKTVPADNYYLFKSCVTGSLYPGIEKSIRFVMDRLGANYTDDPRHSSCTGFGYHTGVVPLMTNLSLNARNFSLAATSRDKNIVCTCPTSYGNLKECKEMLSSDTEKHDQVAKVLDGVGRSYDMTPQVYHASEVFLARLSDIEKRAIYSFKGIRAITHHGCHYAKIFYKDVSSGSFERPMVLDQIATGLGARSSTTRSGLCAAAWASIIHYWIGSIRGQYYEEVRGHPESEARRDHYTMPGLYVQPGLLSGDTGGTGRHARHTGALFF